MRAARAQTNKSTHRDTDTAGREFMFAGQTETIVVFPRHVLGGAAGCNRSSRGGNCAEIHKLLSACGFWLHAHKNQRDQLHVCTLTHKHTLSSAYSKVCLRLVCSVVTEAGLLWACADRSSLLLYWVLNHPVKPRGDVPPRSSIDHFPWHVSMSSLWKLLSA